MRCCLGNPGNHAQTRPGQRPDDHVDSECSVVTFSDASGGGVRISVRVISDKTVFNGVCCGRGTLCLVRFLLGLEARDKERQMAESLG